MFRAGAERTFRLLETPPQAADGTGQQRRLQRRSRRREGQGQRSRLQRRSRQRDGEQPRHSLWPSYVVHSRRPFPPLYNHKKQQTT
jgi:hypothetical protein